MMNQLDRLSQMLDALDSEGRHYVLAVLQMEYDRVQTSRRPVLRLVRSVADAPATTPQGGARHG
jgi:hypothetical protein